MPRGRRNSEPNPVPQASGMPARISTCQTRIIGLLDVMRIDATQFGKIETRWRFADTVEVEPFNRLCRRNKFIIAM